MVVVSLFVLFLPGDDVPSGFPPGTDKVVHCSLFAALALTACLAGVRTRWVIGVLAVYAVTSELIQATPALHRDASSWDAVADFTGALIGCWVARAFRKHGERSSAESRRWTTG
jgi:VanZ family protein